MFLNPLIDISENLINGAVGLCVWATTPFTFFPGVTIAPIYAISISFLIAYLVVAVVRWII